MMSLILCFKSKLKIKLPRMRVIMNAIEDLVALLHNILITRDGVFYLIKTQIMHIMLMVRIILPHVTWKKIPDLRTLKILAPSTTWHLESVIVKQMEGLIAHWSLNLISVGIKATLSNFAKNHVPRMIPALQLKYTNLKRHMKSAICSKQIHYLLTLVMA